MTDSNHIVLGGNGITGTETIHALLRRGKTVTSVGRRPSRIANVHSETADLLNPEDVSRVMLGQNVAYFTVGLPYSAKIWAEQWPVILDNVISGAIKNNTHLVYLDNVYAYGAVDGPMTEQTPIHPTSKKGLVRAKALKTLAAKEEEGLQFTIARSADFYGPHATTSVINNFMTDKIAQGKSGTWLFDASLPHSLTYTPDIGEAMAILGTEEAGRAGTWHIPTAPPLTGQEYAELIAGPQARVKVMSPTMMRLGALFNQEARESLELSYQSTKPYIFDSTLFETTFGMKPTPSKEGFEATLAASNRSKA